MKLPKSLQVQFVVTRMRMLLSNPMFWFLTVAGNGLIALGAYLLYLLEFGINPKIGGFTDALWWSVATMTTVGYGDVTPITPVGRLMGMGFMIFGTALFSSFTALFAATMLVPEITEVEKEMKQIEKELHNR